MSDDLVIVRLILVFFNKIRSAGECNLVDILLNLLRRHSETVIDKCHRLLLGAYNDVNPGLVIKRCLELAHHLQLL